MKVIFRKQITPSGVIFIKIYPEYRNNAGQVRLELEPPIYDAATGSVCFFGFDFG